MNNYELSNFKFSQFQISNLRIFELHGSASILEYQKNIKLRRKRFHMKDTGKSSSRKLRRVVYYLLHRTDPQKPHYKISFSAKISKIENSDFFSIKSPLTPDQPPFKAAIYVLRFNWFHWFNWFNWFEHCSWGSLVDHWPARCSRNRFKINWI